MKQYLFITLMVACSSQAGIVERYGFNTHSERLLRQQQEARMRAQTKQKMAAQALRLAQTVGVEMKVMTNNQNPSDVSTKK